MRIVSGKYLLFGFLFCICSCSTLKKSLNDVPQYFSEESEKQKLISDARYCSQSEDYENAIILYNQLIEKYPLQGTYYTEKANVLYKQGQYAESLIYLNKAIELQDDNIFDSYYLRAEIFYEQEKLQEAKKDFEKATELKKNCSSCYNYLASINSRLYEDLQAIANFKKAIELDPLITTYYQNLALEYAKQNLFDSSLTFLNKAIIINRNKASLYFVKGIILYEKDDRIRADSNTIKSLKMDPSISELLLTEVYHSVMNNKLSFAAHLLDMGISVYPTHIPFLIKRAEICEYKRDNTCAIEFYSRALSIHSAETDWYLKRGKLLFMEQNYNEAIIDFSRVLESQPYNTEILLKRGYALYRLNNSEGAEADWTAAYNQGDNRAKEYLKIYLKVEYP